MNYRPDIARVATTAGAIALCAMLAGCAFTHPNYPDGPKRAKYLDARQPSTLPTTGVESSDVLAACDSLVSRLLSQPRLANTSSPPRYRVADADFSADTHTAFDTTALADLVRDAMVNQARGRLRVSHDDDAEGAAPVDFAVCARVTTVSQSAGGVEENYTQIAFHVVDPLTNDIVFSDLYAVKKSAKGTTAWH